MKELYYKIFYLCIFIFSVGNITAQDCDLNFTVTTTSTPSTCQANGTITVTLGGDLSNISNVQYGLTSADGFTINPQENNVLANIPAGTYTVTARAFCLTNEDYSVVKTAQNVAVAGTYKVPEASFNPSSSRKSYNTCNTGIIVLNVTNGSGTFTFNIISAPDGVPTGVITPTKSGTLYTFPGQNYPAGDYVVQIEDGCYTAVATFTLDEITDFPAFSYSNTTFYPPSVKTSCTTVTYTPGSISSSTTPDYYRYFADGMYEVGIAPTGSMPTQWLPWSSSRQNFELPSAYINYYPTNSLTIYIRLKGCENVYVSQTSNLRKPYPVFSSNTRTCEDYQYYFYPYGDYDGFFCYPLSMVITQTSAGEGQGTIVYENHNVMSTANQYVSLNYGASYTMVTTDANGTVDTRSASPTRGNISLSYTDDNCSTQYKLSYYTIDPCYPIEVTITDPSGDIIHSKTLTSTTSTAVDLEYGKAYVFEAVYVGTNPLRTYRTTINRTSSIPTAYTLSLYSTDQCVEDQGRLQISRSGSGNFPIGTTFTITGPEGYTTQTATATSSTYYYYMPTAKLPAGTYTLTVVNGCGNTTPMTASLTLKGIYSGKELTYSTENTCSGMKVTPSGYMTYQSVQQTNSTFYRLTSGPTGYDKTVIKPGGSFTLSTPGVYKLGITLTNSTAACVINEMTIDYTAPPLALSQTETNAYVCVESSKGIILLSAINGVAPYKYELWNKENTVKEDIPDVVSSEHQVYFNYGKANETYTARISDNCGNKFSQQITLAKLSSARVVYATNNNVCNGDSIHLKCITLGKTAYDWTGPNGFATTTQSPTIPNAQVNMTGWYKVSVMPEFCGEPVQDSVYIQVYPPFAIGTITPDQKTCVRTKPSTLSCDVTGGNGIYTYQWQSSTDGVSNWTNIVGATSVIYAPPAQIKSGMYYYRVIITNTCGVIESRAIKVDVTPCYIRINPDIRVRVNGKK